MPRAKGLNLFDVFLHSGKDGKSSAVTTVVATVQRKAPTNTLHSNAARWNEVLTPKTFIVRKKKPKKISILKKKILMERLKLYVKMKRQSLTPSEQPINVDASRSSAEEAMVKCTLLIYNFVDDIDLEDRDELDEVIGNVKELLMPFGCLMYVAVVVGDVLGPNGIVETTALVEARFGSVESGQSARSVLDGARIGGRAIDIELHHEENLEAINREDHIHGHYSGRDFDEAISSGEVPIVVTPLSAGAHSGDTTSYVLVLEHIVTRDNMADEEEVQEVLRDLREICGTYGPLTSVWIEQTVAGANTMGHDKSMHGRPDHFSSNVNCSDYTIPSSLPWSLLQYSSLETAITAVHNLNGLVIGGSKIEAGLYDWQAYSHDVFSDDYIIDHIVVDNASPPLDVSAISAIPSHALRLKRFIQLDQIEDEDEERELLHDLQSLLSPEMPHIQVSNHNCIFIKQKSSDVSIDGGDDEAELDLDVVITLPSLQDILTAIHYLNDRLISGEVLCMDLLSIVFCEHDDDHISFPSREESRVALYSYSSNSNQLHILRSNAYYTNPLKVFHLCDPPSNRAVVVVRNYFSSEDLDDLSSSFEDVVQMKADLHALAVGSAQSPTDGSDERKHRCEGFLNRCRIYRGDVGCASTDSIDPGDDYVAMVEFRSVQDAEEALLQLDGRLIGGLAISAHLDVTHKSSDSNDEANVSTDAVYGSLPTANTTATVTATENTRKGRVVTNSSCIAAETIVYPTISTVSGSLDDGSDASECAATMTELQAGGKFKIAKTLPKQAFHESPRFTIPIADEPTNVAVKELLKLISTFQIRAKEKNPMNSKLKLRFVCGIKQCLNAVKSNKVRLLLLAPNTEASEVLDDKIESLINEANHRDVPTCYCLSKRVLGKACQLSMKQSAVAVIDPDGAFEYFKVVLKFIRPNDADKKY